MKQSSKIYLKVCVLPDNLSCVSTENSIKNFLKEKKTIVMRLAYQIKLPKVNTLNYIVQRKVYCTLYIHQIGPLCMGREIFSFFLYKKLYYLAGLICTYSMFRKHIYVVQLKSFITDTIYTNSRSLSS